MQIYKNPSITKSGKATITIAAGAIILKDNQILLVKDSDDTFWKFPGGALCDDESMVHAVKREVKEEVGLDVTVDTKREPIVYIKQAVERDKTNYFILYHYFVGEITGKIEATDKKTEQVKFFRIDELPESVGENVEGVLREI